MSKFVAFIMKYLIKLTITSNNLNDKYKPASKLYIVMILFFLRSWCSCAICCPYFGCCCLEYTHHTLLLLSCTKQIPVQLIFNLLSFERYLVICQKLLWSGNRGISALSRLIEKYFHLSELWSGNRGILVRY